MAWKKKYRCVQCGYEGALYDGYGFFKQHIATMTCGECHSLQNIVVGGIIGEIAPSYGSEFGRLCPQCSSQDMKIWDGVTCPKCSGRMEYSGDKEYWT